MWPFGVKEHCEFNKITFQIMYDPWKSSSHYIFLVRFLVYGNGFLVYGCPYMTNKYMTP